MNILIIGFQRSGTTLLRRIFHSHPDIKRMFHEEFLLNRCKNKKELLEYLKDKNIDPNKDNWGEKTPFYPGMRKTSVKVYTQTWSRYFGKTSRILHIVRHPYDVALSIQNKYSNQNLTGALKTYRRSMPTIMKILQDTPRCYSFKYEDLLLNPDTQIPKIMKFCQLPMFDYKTRLANIPNPRYQKIDPTRAFAHKEKFKSPNIQMESVIKIVNCITGSKYES